MTIVDCPNEECSCDGELYYVHGELTVWCGECGDVPLPCDDCETKDKEIRQLKEKIKQLGG